MSGAGGASGSIYDLGYQGYDGPRLGRPAVALGLLTQTLPGRLRDRARRSGQDRAVPDARAVRAAGHPGGRDRGARRPGRRRRGIGGGLADPPRHVPEPDLHAGHAVLRGPGTGAVRARPALRRAAAVLLAGPDPRRLRAGAGGRPVPRDLRDLDRAAAHPDGRRDPGGARPADRAARRAARRSRATSSWPCSRPRSWAASRRSSPPGRRGGRTPRPRSSRCSSSRRSSSR